MTYFSQKVIQPQNLLKDFGYKNPETKKVIQLFYSLLAHNSSQEVEEIYTEWAFHFYRTTNAREWEHTFKKKKVYRDYIAEFGFDPQSIDPLRFVFAVQTYFAFLVKIVTTLVVSPLIGRKSISLLALSSRKGEKLRNVLQSFEEGELLFDLGIRNAWENDFFNWYLLIWNKRLEDVFSEIISQISYYDAQNLQDNPESCRTMIKKLYQRLFPREIRFCLGEYYTPDWLVEHVLRVTLEDDLGNVRKRILDPACGFGTFLFYLVKNIQNRSIEKRWDPHETMQLIMNRIVGMDLNPLAVLVSRSSFLFALGDWLHTRDQLIDIPVLFFDSLHPRPSKDTKVRSFSIENSFHYVVGNPPWISWDVLPDEYRHVTLPLWQHYGLLPKRERGMDSILGGIKFDASMLMTCVSLDHYLTSSGKLGFVVTDSLFKTTEAGQGFRQFSLPDGTPFKPVLVENMVDLKPFEKAFNRTAVAVFQKGKKPAYPVPYNYWSKAVTVGRQHIDFNTSYETFPYDKIVVHDWEASPIDRNDDASIWITGRPDAVKALPRLLGESPYQPREGVNTGGANGVYWVQEENSPNNGLVKITNLVQFSKKEIPLFSVSVEKELLYPLLRAQNVKRWNAAPKAHIIITHSAGSRLRAIEESQMQEMYPHTYAYLQQFEEFLHNRKTQVVQNLMDRGPFYAVFGIGEYSFSPWKVVWTRIAKVEAAVIGEWENKPVIPQETLSLVNCSSENEAHYLTALINSTPFQYTVSAYSQRGGKSMGSKHILKYINIPSFRETNSIHLALAKCSKEAHRSVENHDKEQLRYIESEIDLHSARLWNLSDGELNEIKQSYIEY